MSITAEKIAQIIDGPPFSVGEATLAHLSADDRQSWVQRKNHALAKAEAILSLLQQGEPEGFIERAKVAKMIDDELFSREQVAKCFEAENPNSEASRTCRDKWSAIKTLKRHFDECFSASPLPPAPGAETGK